jgi:lipoprotein-releasing system ATP-binding protein
VPVTLRGLGHRFSSDDPWLFRHLDHELGRGEVHAVTGPSGSGKSTLLGLIAGWGRPAEGSIIREAEGRVSWVFQNPHGVARRTALDHVMLPLLASGATFHDAEREARDLVARFGLRTAAGRPFMALSGGEAQRLMLARGLASQPALLLVDEPTAQLDPHTADSVNRAIAAAASASTIVVVATHDRRTRDACTHHLDLQDFRVESAGE